MIIHCEMDSFASVPSPSAAAVESAKDLNTKIRTASPDLADDFDNKYDAWRKTWSNIDVSENSAVYVTGTEFDILVALGPKVVPFVVYTLSSGKDYMAVELYNKIEADANYRVNPQDIPNSKSTQLDAGNGIIEINFKRNTEFQEALKAWAEFRLERQFAASSFMFTEGEGYWRLAEMGPSIIAPVMLEYYNDRGGWWHELLHELVHGQVSGSGIFFKDVLFDWWKDWFEHKDHQDAPQGPDARARLGHGYRVTDF